MTNTEIKKIANNKKIKFCYITKGTYYRSNYAGYTDFITRAGIYTKEEAVEHALYCKDVLLIPINIEEHNTGIMEEVEDLLKRYIKNK